MKLFAHTFPIPLLLLLIYYFAKTPLEKIYAFDNSAKLWIMHGILAFGLPLLLMVATALPLGQFKTTLLYDFDRLRYLCFHYGLLVGITYIIAPLSYRFFLFMPPIAAIISYFLSIKIIMFYEKLVPASNNNALTQYTKPIRLFQNKLTDIVNLEQLPFKPKLHVRKTIKPNCYVFGTSSNDISIVITTGLLHSINQGNLNDEEITAIIYHEIGHVLNGDLRLISSIKIFWDLRIIQFAIIGALMSLILLHLHGIAFAFVFNPQALAKLTNAKATFAVYIPLFLILYIGYSLIHLLIRRAFKTREFFADAQALQKFKKEDVYINTLRTASLPFVFLVPHSIIPAAFPEIIFRSWLFTGRKILVNLICFIFKKSRIGIVRKVEGFISVIKPLFLTHPSHRERIDAILQRKYFPGEGYFLFPRSYLTVGTTLLISFVFLLSISPKLSRSELTPIIYLTYTTFAYVIIGNAHLKLLNKHDLAGLRDSFVSCGFVMTPPEARESVREFCLVNYGGIVPFAILILVWAMLSFGESVPVIATMFAVALPFLMTHVFTNFFLTVLAWSKRNESDKLDLRDSGK